MFAVWLDEIALAGFAVVPGVFNPIEAARLTAELGAALADGDQQRSISSRAGSVVASRHLLQSFPAAATLSRRSPLVELLSAVLGPQFGLVRVLFFDKPPDRTWSLAWHKDLTVAVCDNTLPSRAFTKPTTKAGVPHVEAPSGLLEQMLTLRIHLDDVADDNGPLKLIPRSHLSGKEAVASDCEPAVIRCRAGDVLAMRPLVSHSSGASLPGCPRHRRILHLEFAGQRDLPDGYQWRDFVA